MVSGMPSKLVPGIVPPEARKGAAETWFVFRSGELLVREGDDPLPERGASASLPTEGEPHYLGTMNGAACFALALAPSATPPAGHAFAGLRALFTRLPGETWHAAGRALQILEWDRTHRFCGACATATIALTGERAKKCPACGLTAYPRVAPAIIVLVHRGDEAILARGPRTPAKFLSTLAGFVEPGESLEETLAREVEEEVGVHVKNVRYFGSQPWPFPHSLMVGYFAEHADGEPRPDGVELDVARWFRFDALPEIPPRISIARQLIDAWVASRTGGPALS
jgi:NAD+ diphosphatase